MHCPFTNLCGSVVDNANGTTMHCHFTDLCGSVVDEANGNTVLVLLLLVHVQVHVVGDSAVHKLVLNMLNKNNFNFFH